MCTTPLPSGRATPHDTFPLSIPCVHIYEIHICRDLVHLDSSGPPGVPSDPWAHIQVPHLCSLCVCVRIHTHTLTYTPNSRKNRKILNSPTTFFRLQRMPDVDKLDKSHIHSYYPPAHVIHVCMHARHTKTHKHVRMHVPYMCFKHLYGAYYTQKYIHIYIYIYIYTYTYM